MWKFITILILITCTSCVTQQPLDFSIPLEPIVVSSPSAEITQYYTFKKLEVMPTTNTSYMSADEIEKYIKKHTDVISDNIILSDEKYVKVNHIWIVKTIGELQKLKFYFKLTYIPEGFDCDNFASLSISLINMVASYSELKAQVLVGRIDVLNKKSFADIPAGGGHALNFFVSEKGIYIFEPQNGTIIDLKNYPNKDYIFRLFLD